MGQPAVPNFFIVGAGKAGTTSLYAYLRQHPQIYMSPVKEPCYFASEIRVESLIPRLQRHQALQSLELARLLDDGEAVKPFGWIAGEWDDYLRLFRRVNGEKAIGEASAAHLWSPTAAANIHARFPEAKIIMILRDPAERAFSQYLHQLSVGLTGATFRGHLERCERGGEHELSALYPFLEIGLYHRQVKRFLDLFPRRQICIYWYEDAWRRPANLLADVFRFLRVDADFEPDMSRHSHRRRAPRMVRTHHLLKKSGFWYPLRDLVPGRLLPSFRRFAFRGGRSLTIRPEDRRYLIDYYREDIRNLAGLLNRDLSTWLR